MNAEALPIRKPTSNVDFAIRSAFELVKPPIRRGLHDFLVMTPASFGLLDAPFESHAFSRYRDAVACRTQAVARLALFKLGLPHQDVAVGLDGSSVISLVEVGIRLARGLPRTSTISPVGTAVPSTDAPA